MSGEARLEKVAEDQCDNGDVMHACANQLGMLQFVEPVCDDELIVLTVDALPCWPVLCIEYGFSAAYFIQWLLVPIPSTAPVLAYRCLLYING